MKTLVRISILALVALAAACGGGPSTSVTQVWKAPSPPAAPMRSVVVFAANMSEANRRTAEDIFTGQLKERGVDAQQSYNVFPGKLPTREEAKAATQRANIDGILVLSLKGVRERQTYVPGSYTGDFWGGYYGMGWDTYSPGYVVTDEIVGVETTLWDARAHDSLVWSAVTQTTNPETGSEFAKSVADKVVPQLEQGHFIPPKQK